MLQILTVKSVIPLTLFCIFQVIDAQHINDTIPFQMENIRIKETLYHDFFDSTLSQWVTEQMPGGSVVVCSGKLEIDDSAGCTVWFRHKLTAPVMIEYDATLIHQNGKNDRVSDLNCFWMATDPEHPDDIFLNSKNRNGQFSHYHCLRLYYVGYGANNNTTTRFRRYPGDCSRPLIQGTDKREYMNIPNLTRKIQIISTSHSVLFLCDGEVVFYFEDSNPYTAGWFGFRTVNNHMTIDNFSVHAIRIQNEYE